MHALPPALTAVGLAAVAACGHYEPQPIDPTVHPAAYRSRRLDDPALAAWVERYAGAPVDGRWSARQLGVVALAHRADVERARREWLAARAAVTAAGARPAPGLEGGVERAVGGREDGSPWVVAIAALFTLELGGKRGARIQAARADEAAAAADLALTARQAVSRVRQAVLALEQARAARQDAAAFHDALRAVEGRERERFAEAALGSGEVARTASEAATARAEVAAAEREILAARAALAAALAVPVAQVRDIAVASAPARGCVWAEAVGDDSVAALTLQRRPEVVRALAGYAVAEADVRARVAGQSPDLELGPGFIWDQGVHRWTLGAALPALLGLRATGPVATAQARRHAAAARVAEAQDDLLGEAAAALEGCRGAALEVATADSLRAAAARVASLARGAYDRGEAGRLELARAELLVARAEAAMRGASRGLEQAGLSLELAAAEWLDAGTARWPDPRTDTFTPDQEH